MDPAGPDAADSEVSPTTLPRSPPWGEALVLSSHCHKMGRVCVRASIAGLSGCNPWFFLHLLPPPQSDLLLGILDILDPEYFLQGGGEELQEQALLLGGGGAPVPGPALAPLGAAPVKLEALNELIHFDHIYTKPVEGVCEEGVCEESVTEVKMEEEVLVEEVVVVEVEEVEEEDDDGRSVKEETEEVDIPESQPDGSGLFSASPALCGGFDEAPCLADAYSDSGYERSPSPFSDMSSPLCPEGSWDDVFANELFPQLISV